MTRCDLHVHSRYSTDSGNFALRRARLGESYTEPERVYRVCKTRGMDFVTITDHNTLDGALRIAHLPGTFLSEEVTTTFPGEQVPLHVLVWDLSEDDHRDLQPLRGSVFEVVRFFHERALTHALAHPLYRMGDELTASHIEQLLLLFGVWEGRNGARSPESNELACRIARRLTPELCLRLADKHGLEAVHGGRIALIGGSDDHGALDIATTWTECSATTVETFLFEVDTGLCRPQGAHGSTTKLAHALTALSANAYRESGGVLPELLAARIEGLFDSDADDAQGRHVAISSAMSDLARLLGERARSGGLGPSMLPGLGGRLGALAFAAALQAPYLATAHHHADSQHLLRSLERDFFGIDVGRESPHSLVFTDTFVDANGVAGTMRQLAAAAAAGSFAGRVVTTCDTAAEGVLSLRPDWVAPLPAYETLQLAFPVPTDVLACVERERPDVIHVATPGPVGLAGLAIGRLLGIPVVGSYHTELGPYALQLTRDLLVAQAIESYVDWFYRQCATVLAPTGVVARALESRGLRDVGSWGRGVDHDLFDPCRRDDEVRAQLLGEGETLLLSVGRVSNEKRLDLLLQAFARIQCVEPATRLVVVGDGPARHELERTAPAGVTFLGEARGEQLAALYAAADIFCFTSATDTFGQVLLEAGASGLAIVAVAAGGALELVVDGATGVLAPVDDSFAFAEAVLGLLHSPAKRAAYGTAARHAAVRRSWPAAIEQLVSEYRRACSESVRRLPAAA